MIRSLLALTAVAAVSLGLGCASTPHLGAASEATLIGMSRSVEAVSEQFEDTIDALAQVRDDWDTDPDNAIAAYQRELMALRTAVEGVTDPDGAPRFANWDGMIDAAEREALAADDDAAVNSALDRLRDRVSDLRQAFAPQYERMLDLGERLRASPSQDTVEENLPEIRRAVHESEAVLPKFEAVEDEIERLVED